jgi:hypothetical protein
MSHARHAASPPGPPPAPGHAGPRPRRRPPWAQRPGRRRGLQWHLEHAFGLRLLLALLLAGLLLGVVNRWENCRDRGFRQGCLQSDAGGIVSVANVESLSIVTAAMLFLLERNQRRQRENREAMELILTCQQAGARLSFARNEAIERLSAQGIWLDGLDLSGAQLDQLWVPYARWRQVVLHGASLRGACFHDADLQGSDLAGADLSGADLRHADLRGTKLQGALLRNADLGGADLLEAQLDGADLDGANLEGANLEGCRRDA